MAGLAGPIIDFGILIIGAMVLGGVATFFRQPLIIAYIAVGVLFGSQGLGLIGDQAYLYSISSELGIAMLLFVVGLELSIKKMLEVRSVVIGGTLAMTTLFAVIGMFTGYFLGFTLFEGVYIGLMMAFASTLLIIKSLGEKHAVDTLAGRIIIGSLVFEDIIVIVAISILGVLAGVEPTGFVKWVTNLPGISLIPSIENIALFVGALVLLGVAYLMYRFVAKWLFRYFAASPEMLFVSALGFLFSMAFLAAELGFSVAIGAFIAGVIVANTDYYLDVLGRVRTLATFFALLFFATLGFNVTFENFTSLLVPVLIITALVVIVKPILIGTIVRLFGYDKITAINVGLHMAQISEFGLILITFGVKFGHVRDSFLTITILVLLLSFLVSMYYMRYSAAITAWLQRRFHSLATDRNAVPEVAVAHATAVLYGAEHIDEEFIAQVRNAKPNIVVVDPDPESVEYVRRANIPVIVGSLENDEVIERLPIENLELVIATIPDFEANLFVVEHIRRVNKKAVIVLTSQSMHDALELYRHGATYVHVASFVDDTVVQRILVGTDPTKLLAMRTAHIARLEKIVRRASAAVDIDEFLTRITEQQLASVGGVLKRGGAEVDNAFKKLKGKK